LARQGCNSARQAYAYRPLRVRSTDRVDQRFHGLLVTAACDGSAGLRSHRPGRNRESWRSPRGPAHRVDPRGSVVGLLTHAKVNNDIEGIVMAATTKCGRGHRQPVPLRRRRVHLLQLVDQSTHAGHLLEFTSTAVTVHPTP